ncbi:hypothetical protein AAV94_03720 [Lampropedia cohaerens]|uniref:Xanthine dehydrogenase accessory protein XdhC n=1 Tax=Lampropedia cohaerens TaxID=1610491 RepID=A0A0U1Q1R5_9BURK|nr:xanthine dehydrogenase accessory protein XdhC [Lampropedia cohaerens]KKW68690.1 hypothetical protein AAV94_03720 [Lampropedia cohaerens]
MPEWLMPLHAALLRGEAAVLVTVVATRGSVPRNAGARMLVTARAVFDTIGGGHLELQAIAQARDCLAEYGAGHSAQWRVQRYALGASLGQCCGGAVELLFECVDSADLPWVQHSIRLGQGAAGQTLVRLGRYTQAGRELLCGTTLEQRRVASCSAEQRHPAHEAPEALQLAWGSEDKAGTDYWLEEHFVPQVQAVALFGAGHVGRAIVRAAQGLPLQVHWFDERADQFPSQWPGNVVPHPSDDVVAEVKALPAGAAYLILTHNHALDFALTRAVLDRGDFAFLGLIGSATKRRSFEQRLRTRGYTQAQLQRLVCPLGISGVTAKQPAVIAIAILAQLLQLPGLSASA